YVPRLAKVVEDPGSGLPDLARDICRMVLEQIDLLTARLAAVSAKLAAASRAAAMPRQLQTMPGVGPIGALAIETFAPPMEQFRRGRDFAAWLVGREKPPTVCAGWGFLRFQVFAFARV
ncbi:MAG: transposase, partial [Pseudaminobacter sp.]|nr:transposase [Pseudaminobacter sp.]